MRLAHHEVAEHLHPRHRLQFFGIDEISIDLDRIGFAEQLHQAVVFLNQVVRQCGNAQALLAGPDQAEDVVDLEVDLARAGAVAASFAGASTAGTAGSGACALSCVSARGCPPAAASGCDTGSAGRAAAASGAGFSASSAGGGVSASVIAVIGQAARILLPALSCAPRP